MFNLTDFIERIEEIQLPNNLHGYNIYLRKNLYDYYSVSDWRLDDSEITKYSLLIKGYQNPTSVIQNKELGLIISRESMLSIHDVLILFLAEERISGSLQIRQEPGNTYYIVQ
jgi:hypothetical protein